MKCYYEVLNVSRDADSSEIKNSYRKLALKWHPDKNLSNPEEAKEQFQTVQNAYEVLSDPQERAWYDSHREQLLRGAGSDFNDESLDLIPFFTASCYKGFEDDAKGFYSIYREVFKKLVAEEVDYLDDPEDISKIPEFGKSDTDYEIVNEFYSYWLSFSTSKSYTWLDKYDIREADNRRILKLVEKENNKIRQKARKERNDEIRRLVSFVRKRDKRVIAYAKLLEEKAEENKKKVADTRRQKIIKRQEELEEEKKRHKDIGVYTMNNFQEQLAEIEKHLAAEFGDSEDDYSTMDSSDEDEIIDSKKPNAKQIISDEELYMESNQNLYCTACNKIFKTIKSFENHEKSKKHKENVMNLKVDVDLTSDESKDSCKSDSEELELSDEKTQKSSKLKKKQNKKQVMVNNDTDSDCDYAEILNTDSNSRNRKARRSKAPEKKSTKKTKNKPNATENVDDPIDETIESDVKNILDNEDDSVKPSVNGTEKPLKKSQLRKAKNNKTNTTDCVDEPIFDSIESRILNMLSNKNASMNGDTGEKPQKKTKKLSQKKKAEIAKDIDVSNLDTSHCCAMCKNEFSSKNKLFDHLKKTGHQIYLPAQLLNAPTCSTGSSKGNKRKK